MNEEEVMNKLKNDCGFSEVYHKTEFVGYRINANEVQQKVAVDILDMGSEEGDMRYTCHITTDDGKKATGNPAPSIDLAIGHVHWFELDN